MTGPRDGASGQLPPGTSPLPGGRWGRSSVALGLLGLFGIAVGDMLAAILFGLTVLVSTPPSAPGSNLVGSTAAAVFGGVISLPVAASAAGLAAGAFSLSRRISAVAVSGVILSSVSLIIGALIFAYFVPTTVSGAREALWLVAPIPTIAPEALCASFRDNFDRATLGPGWSWMPEDPGQWSLTARPGFLRIIPQTQEPPYTAARQNLLLRSAPAGDYEVTTHLEFHPTGTWQYAMLFIYWDDQDSLSLVYKGPVDGSNIKEAAAVGLDFVFGSHGGTRNTPTDLVSLYLRITKVGGTYTGYFGADGRSWTYIYKTASDIANYPRPGLTNATPKIGIGAFNGNTSDPPPEVDFDLFCMKS
jgi:hypothetical protein